MQFTIVGAGSSSSVPQLRCVINSSKDGMIICDVCNEATFNPQSRNRRCNPCLLIKTESNKHILIDCGKTFRESVMKVFPALGVRSLDSVILTHDHADAILGMDDLRELQPYAVQRNATTGETEKIISKPIDIYGSESTIKAVSEKFAYLFPTNGSHSVYRWTAKLRKNIITDFECIHVEGINITALPVWHGHDYICYGYEFGVENNFRSVYLSDISNLPEKTAEYLLEGDRIEYLIIDALNIGKMHGTHFNLDQALAVVQRLEPKKTFLVGMAHEFNYYTFDEKVKSRHEIFKIYDIEMAYDGLTVKARDANTS